MKKSAKPVVVILCIIAVLAAAFLLVWQFDVFGIFKEYKVVPELELKGKTEITLEGGDSFEEPGFVAKIGTQDATDKVEVDYKTVDTSKVGSYELNYSLSNTKGRNTVTKTRLIKVVDTTAPEITIKGDKTVKLQIGTAYKDAGASAADKVDGDLTKTIKVDNKVNVNEKGKYTVTYTVKDAAGNEAKAERIVIVSKQSSGSVVYLTFDDGPSYNTIKILDLLKEYDCHATFFIVGQNIPGNEDILKRMAKEGHTLAVHTYTHDYAAIYTSPEAFWEDNQKTRDLIKEVTGVEAKFMRFPGGASNTISANYCSGIMGTLTEQCKDHGYEYFDWNISSGDANADGLPAAQLYDNIMAGIHENYDSPIVLMHDTGAKDTTVTAVAKVLKVGLSEGYSFEALDETVSPIHHAVNN
ncbi:MAG: polysaccharide deacetylase family protein [Clostridia bacterium]|nr:polysaccharide deacetylase family protein [Clostridia bacterium]